MAEVAGLKEMLAEKTGALRAAAADHAQNVSESASHNPNPNPHPDQFANLHPSPDLPNPSHPYPPTVPHSRCCS